MTELLAVASSFTTATRRLPCSGTLLIIHCLFQEASPWETSTHDPTNITNFHYSSKSHSYQHLWPRYIFLQMLFPIFHPNFNFNCRLNFSILFVLHFNPKQRFNQPLYLSPTTTSGDRLSQFPLLQKITIVVGGGGDSTRQRHRQWWWRWWWW